MKSIKNSLKKLGHRLSSGAQHTFEDPVKTVTDLESKRLLYHEGLPKVMTFRNYEFPEDTIHTRVIEDIEDLEVREDDIFLLSYPATSSHILEDIVQSLIAKQKEKSSTEGREGKLHKFPIARLEVSNPYGHIRWLKSLKSPRLFVSNLPYDLMPKQLRLGPTCKIIYVLRNPKDHIIAYYYQHRFKGVQLSLDDFIDLYMNGYLLYGNYFEHVLSFWQLAQLYPDNVFFVTYEELKMIPLDIARLISEFLALDLTINEINQVVAGKHSMGNHIIANKETSTLLSSSNGENEKGEESQISPRKTSLKIHKFHGVLGDWINYFTPEQARRFDEIIKLKFESKHLNLTCDASTAIKRIKKYGRILDCHPQDSKRNSLQFYLRNGNVKRETSKKLVLTKDEALFIRKKDRVVILDETFLPPRKPNYFERFWMTLNWCCFNWCQINVPDKKYEQLN